MFNSSTPKTETLHKTSSVFITPPASAERKNAPPPHLPPLPSPPSFPVMPPPFPTPGETPTLPPRPVRSRPKLFLYEGEDIVSGLHNGGYRIITRQILFYLEPSDLSNALLVSSKWSQLICSFSVLQTRIKGHQRKLHRDAECREAENLDKPFASSALFTDRRPLRDTKNCLMSNGRALTPSLPPPAMTIPKRVMYKHRPCPQCRAPSKQLNLRRAECTKCRFDYCSACLMMWHDGECERQRSPKRLAKENSICSKRSKKNLRRL